MNEASSAPSSRTLYRIVKANPPALAEVRAILRANGPAFAEALALGYEDKRGRGNMIAEGAELAQRALAVEKSDRKPLSA